MRSAIRELKKKALTNHDILRLVNNKTNLMTYPELTEFDSIEDCIGPHGALVVLYETRKNFGHWCAVLQRPDCLEFFDPYGLFPDEELKFIPDHFRQVSNQLHPHLTYLLYKSRQPIEYNDYRLQSKLKDVSTCGRHVALRLLLRDLDIDQYSQFLLKDPRLSPDDIVTYLTRFI